MRSPKDLFADDRQRFLTISKAVLASANTAHAFELNKHTKHVASSKKVIRPHAHVIFSLAASYDLRSSEIIPSIALFDDEIAEVAFCDIGPALLPDKRGRPCLPTVFKLVGLNKGKKLLMKSEDAAVAAIAEGLAWCMPTILRIASNREDWLNLNVSDSGAEWNLIHDTRIRVSIALIGSLSRSEQEFDARLEQLLVALNPSSAADEWLEAFGAVVTCARSLASHPHE